MSLDDTITPEDVMNDFQGTSNISLQEILNTMISGDENLDLKTDIDNPLDLARLYTLSKILKKFELVDTYEMLKIFIKKFLRYRVSHKRQSRKEIIDAISGMFDRMQTKLTISEKLTSNLKESK